MLRDQNPIPREALPPGWGPADDGGDRVAYRRSRPFVELLAQPTDADRSHPALGLCRCWELRYRVDVGGFPISAAIGRVSTRSAAIEGLLEGMSRVNNVVTSGGASPDVRSVLDEIRLDDLVPDGTPGAI